MPRSPDSTTDTYLDVLRTLGVPDAALERHHDAGPETPLRVAIDGDRGSPTADLLSALAATGRLLDLRDGLTPGNGDRLTTSLARFGLRVKCDAVDDAGANKGADPEDGPDATDLLLRITDDVTGETVRITTARDPEAAIATLREELPGADAISTAELLDGRHLVADPRELGRLAERYGPRLQPYDDPLLVPEDAVDLDDRDVELDDHDAVPEEPSTSTTAPSPIAASAPSSSTASAPSSTAVSASDAASSAATDADESFGEFVSAVDDSAAEAVESALETSGSKTHTIEGDGEEVAAASNATVGGGPKRTVSTSGIDDVFEQLESSMPDGDRPSATTQTMSESSDPPTDATVSNDDVDVTPNGLTGGPTRTVSTTSADDILEQATGERDFEEIAAEEGDADPDAVLANAEDVPPALEDSDTTAPLVPGEEAAVSGSTESVADADKSALDANEPTVDTEEPTGAADVPPADPATAPEQDAEEPTAVPLEGSEVTASTGTDVEAPTSVDADVPSADGDAASTLPADELLEDDVELRRGSEPVDQPTAPEVESVDADPTESAGPDSTEPADADGPLAAAGGVARPDAAAGPSESDAGTSTETQQSSAATADRSVGSDSSATDGPEIEESAGTEDDPGLVGRITSTIFGR